MDTEQRDRLEFKLEISISATRDRVWEAILNETDQWWLSGGNGKPMDLKIEAFPGGRLYRDLGKGRGHFWGHVQVIKPPELLEVVGPMFTSMPITHHLAFRLEEERSGGEVRTRVSYHHQAFGPIPDDLRTAVVEASNESVLKGLKNHVEH